MVGLERQLFVDDHRLYLDAGWHAKCSDLGWNDLTDIRIVPVLLVCLVVIGVELALVLREGFNHPKLLVQLDFRHSTLDRR